MTQQCFPSGCTDETEKDEATRVCFSRSHCVMGTCVPDELGKETCEEALFDADDLDEGAQLYFEQAAPNPLRLVRYTEQATPDNLAHVWEPRILGKPFSADGGWTPSLPVTGLLDAYVVPGGVHSGIAGGRQAGDRLHHAAHSRIIDRGDDASGAVGDRRVVDDDDLEVGVVDP